MNIKRLVDTVVAGTGMGLIHSAVKIKQWRKKHIDYRIVDEYYDTNGDGHYYKKYIKKYYFKK